MKNVEKVKELSIENMDIITEVDDKAGAASNDDQNEWFEFWTITSIDGGTAILY